MRMHPYLKKPWQSKTKKQLMATFSLCLIIGSGFSYFLMAVVKLRLTASALCGSALCLLIFLILNFCSFFKAGKMQDLNETMEQVSNDFVREIDAIIKHEQKLQGSGDQDKLLLLYVETLSVARKFQLAQDLVEISLKRLKSRRVPKSKKYKTILDEERERLETSALNLFKGIERLQAALISDFPELLQILLDRLLEKTGNQEEEQANNSQLLQFIWQVCVPLYSM